MGGSMMQGQVFWRGLALFLFNFYLNLLLHLEIILLLTKLCYTFEEKNFFSATIILWKKSEGWCVGLGQKVGCLREGRMNCLKYLKRGWIRKEGRGNKNFKVGSKLGQGVGALKRGSGTLLQSKLVKQIIQNILENVKQKLWKIEKLFFLNERIESTCSLKRALCFNKRVLWFKKRALG